MIAVLVNLLIIFTLIYFLYQKAQAKPLRIFFIPALILKLSAGILLGIIYRFYYTGGDTFNYFHDAVVYSDFALQSPSYFLKLLVRTDVPENLKGYFIYAEHPRALITSKILSFFTLITRNNYWISGIYFSLFSFAGMWYLSNKIAVKYPDTKMAAAIGFLFFPSVIFWSAGIMKESLIMGALSFLFAYVLENIPDFKITIWKKSLLIIIFSFLLWQLKYYYLAVFLSVSFTTICSLQLYFNTSIFRNKTLKLLMMWILLFCIFFGASTLLYPTLQIDNFLFFLLHTHDNIYANSSPENLIHYNNLNADYRSLLRNLPLAFFSGLFRPAIWEINSFLQIIPAIEHLFILLSTILVIRKLKDPISEINIILLFSIIIYILLLAILMAFAAPNFGTLIRYKVGFLPFFVYLVCIDNPILSPLQELIKKDI